MYLMKALAFGGFKNVTTFTLKLCYVNFIITNVIIHDVKK